MSDEIKKLPRKWAVFHGEIRDVTVCCQVDLKLIVCYGLGENVRSATLDADLVCDTESEALRRLIGIEWDKATKQQRHITELHNRLSELTAKEKKE